MADALSAREFCSAEEHNGSQCWLGQALQHMLQPTANSPSLMSYGGAQVRMDSCSVASAGFVLTMAVTTVLHLHIEQSIAAGSRQPSELFPRGEIIAVLCSVAP